LPRFEEAAAGLGFRFFFMSLRGVGGVRNARRIASSRRSAVSASLYLSSSVLRFGGRAMPMSHGQKAEVARLAAEQASLREALVNITLEWSHVENNFAYVLQSILREPSALFASAIYFAPAGAEVRINIVDAAFITLAEMSPHHERVIHAWQHVVAHATKTRRVRNAVAHGMIVTIKSLSGKNHVRLTAPLFDFRRIGSAIAKKQLPGLSSHDIMQSAKQMVELRKALDLCANVASALMDRNETTLLQKLAQLEADLKIEPPQDDQTKSTLHIQPLSFRRKRKADRKAAWKKPT
jgi:hypothetical protein